MVTNGKYLDRSAVTGHNPSIFTNRAAVVLKLFFDKLCVKVYPFTQVMTYSPLLLKPGLFSKTAAALWSTAWKPQWAGPQPGCAQPPHWTHSSL